MFRLILSAFFVTLLMSSFFISTVVAQSKIIKTQKYDVQLVEITSGLEHPWGLAFLPDGRILVTERPGRLRIVKDGKLQPEPVAGLPQVVARGQGGLLDVALHPDFKNNNLVYLSYSGRDDNGIGTDVARATLKNNRLQDVQVIFRMKPKSSKSRHFGSRLAFDPNGFLFITLGDRGERDRAQNPADHAGSIIRINDDGKIPEANPYVEITSWKPEIYSIGHRNIQGASIHPESGVLWIHEHGPQGGDEINVIRPGVNYGWPVITYGVNYVIGTKIGEGTHKDGMAQPLYYWVPSIAPSGMTFYTGEKFKNWQGDLFVGALKDRMLVRLSLNGETITNEERFLKNEIGRIRDVAQGPDGLIYILTDENDGMLARLEPAGTKGN